MKGKTNCYKSDSINYYKVTTLSVNTSSTDPSTMVSIVEDTGAIDAIRANSHRYLGKKTAEGEVTICQLDDSNSNYYLDGSIADLTGNDGDVFMKLPVFWYKWVSYDKLTLWYGIEPYGSEWKKWKGNNLIGVYKATLQNNKLYSISGVSPSGGLTYNNAKSYISNRGTGYSLIKFGHHVLMSNLFLFLYKNTNSQSICGRGIPYSSSNLNGGTNILGMEDTNVNNGTDQPVNFWGLENWWGERYEFIDNCVLTADNYVGVSNDPFVEKGSHVTDVDSGFRESINLKYGLSYLDVGATSTTGLCDGFIAGVKDNVLARTRNDRSLQDGIFYLDASITPTQSHAVFGTRIAFIGNIVQKNNPTEFKNIISLE